jgi:hypothetical protein
MSSAHAHCTHAFDQEITMNARFSLLRARTAPGVLAAAIGLAFGLSAPVQAQYRYPGTASSSGHVARAARVRARAPERAASTRAGETAPRGLNSWVGTPFPVSSGNPVQPGNVPRTGGARPVAAGAGRRAVRSRAEHPASGYGARESSGSPQTPVHQGYASPGPASARPVSRSASVSPVRAGARGALNYGPSQTSNTNFRNSVTNNTSGPSAPNMNSSQPTSVPGPNGPVHVGSPTSYTGANGTKHGLGQQTPDLTGGGFGHQVTRQQNSMANIGRASGGGAPQGAFGMDPYKTGNGSAGAMKGDRTNPNFQKGQSKEGGVAVYDGLGHTLVSSGSTEWNGTTKSGHPDNGIDRNGTEWKKGVVWDGTDEHGTKWRDGKNAGGTVPSQDELDRRKDKLGGSDVAPEIVDAGPGEIVSGTGQVVQPGKKKGQDTGGGQTGDAGDSNSGGQNAQGQYIAPSGQDAPVKPKEVGTLKMNYNGKAGAIDPKQSGINGGGG